MIKPMEQKKIILICIYLYIFLDTDKTFGRGPGDMKRVHCHSDFGKNLPVKTTVKKSKAK